MLRRLAGTALTTAAAFLMVVAIMLDSPSLFYMGTAMTVMLLASRLQAYLAVRWLRFDRTGSATVTAGDVVTMEISVWSDHRVKRPLVIIRDKLPRGLVYRELSPSLPVAPAYDVPISTQYQLRPIKRGHFRWSGVEVIGYDALGLVRLTKDYSTTASADLVVWPRPVPVNLDIHSAAGWGISENESGQSRGAGIEPRGIREYSPGDPMRRIHWPSSARTGTLMVKEFEAGSNLAVAFAIQDTERTEIGVGAKTTLELMCSHCLYLCELFLAQGATISFPGIEERISKTPAKERANEIKDLLAHISADRKGQLGELLAETAGALPQGSTVYAMLGVADASMPNAALALKSQGTKVVALLYDAAAFLPKGRKLQAVSATDQQYIMSLENAGVQTMIVPLEAIG